MNKESFDPYQELPLPDHELVRHYQPSYLNKGGDHLVYEMGGEDEKYKDVVFKASRFKIKDILIYNAEHGKSLDELPETMTGWSGKDESPQEEVEIKNKQIQQLREYFGRDHTLNERRYLMKVPINQELLEQIFKDDEFGRALPPGARNLKEVWTAAIVQQKSEEIADENLSRESLHFGSFLEKRKGDLRSDPEEYKKLNQAFIKDLSDNPEDSKLFLKIQDDPKSYALTDLVAKAQVDRELKETLQDLVRKMISFAEDTGNILALAGRDNVILFKKDEHWTYLLVDAIPVHNEPMFGFAKDALHHIASGEDIQLTKYEKEIIMKVYNFTRVVNGLALSLGIFERLHLLEEGDKEVDLEKVIQ